MGYWLNQSKEIANNYFDIKSVKGSEINKNIDIFTYSFPCQDISSQGNQKGFSRESKTRSGLLWEIERIFKELGRDNLPKYLLLENVKAMLNHKNIYTYNEWKKTLDKLGYISQEYVLNSSDFGSCQNRERVFVISVLKSHMDKTNFTFPIFKKRSNKTSLKTVLIDNENYIDKYNRYELLEKNINKNNIKKFELKNYTNFNSENFVFDINYSGPTLTATGALSKIKLFYGKNKIRELLPEECFKYMGFDTRDYIHVDKTNLISDAKKIFLCGNSISVEVLEAIFKSFKF